MNSDNTIKSGKRIYELDSLGEKINSDAVFPMSQNNLAKKVTLLDMKVAFNGDEEEASETNYYSSAMIEKIRDALNLRLNTVEQDVLTVSKNFAVLQNFVYQKVNDLDSKITNISSNLTESIDNLSTKVDNNYNDLSKKITDLDTKVDNNYKTLDNKIDTMNNNLTNKINDLETNLSQKITNLENTISNSINNKLEDTNNEITNLGKRITQLENKLQNISGITIGKSVPSSLAHNAIYLQYFE